MVKEKQPRDWGRAIVSIITVGTSLYHIYVFTIGSGELDPIYQHRPIHLLLFLVLTFLCYNFSGKRKKGIPLKGLALVDVLLALLSVSACSYILVRYDYILDRFSMASPVSPLDLFFGGLLILIILEATRRVVGMPLVWTTLVTFLYGLFGSHLSGIWNHPGLSVPRLVDWMFMSAEGIWGPVLGVSSTFIFLFVLFGRLLLGLGGGQFFTDLAMALAGRYTGGPAKVAVLASALFGTLSGSASANVATTGTFTVPMMKRLGYRPLFAGAVECAASTGGMIAPPIMAATVFLMTEMTGIPYVEICIAAIIPAIFYFLVLGLQIHFQAKKYGLLGLPREQIPSARKVLRQGWQFFVPFAVVIVVLFAGYSPLRAAIWGLGASVVAAFVRKETRRDLGKKLWISLEDGAKAAIMVVMCCAAAAMLVGVLYATGIGGKFSSAMLAIAGNSLFVALLMGMLGCLVLGLPLPPPAAYLLTAIMIAPAAVSMGVPPMAAHLFAIYYSSLGQITPPAGAAMFVAGAIAGANPMTVGFVSMRLAVVGFVVPFMFCYNWSLLMIGTPGQIVKAIIFAGISFVALASGFEGWLLERIKWWQRGLFIAAGFLLIFPDLAMRGVAVVLLLVGLAAEVKKHGFGTRSVQGGGRANKSEEMPGETGRYGTAQTEVNHDG